MEQTLRLPRGLTKFEELWRGGPDKGKSPSPFASHLLGCFLHNVRKYFVQSPFNGFVYSGLNV